MISGRHDCALGEPISSNAEQSPKPIDDKALEANVTFGHYYREVPPVHDQRSCAR